MAKNETLGRVAGLLNKFQARLDAIRADVAAVKTRATKTQDDVALAIQMAETAKVWAGDAHKMAAHALLDHETQKGVNKLHGQKFEDLRVALNKTSQLALDSAAKIKSGSVAPEDVANSFAAQAAVNKEVSDSLYKLRDSIQASFNGVRGDMEKAQRFLQTANARASEAESNVLALRASLQLFEQRLQVAETNSKLARDLFSFLRESLKEGKQ